MKGRVFSSLVLWMAVLTVILMGWVPGYYLFFNAIAVVGLLEYYDFLRRDGARLAYGSALVAAVALLSGSMFLHQQVGEAAGWGWTAGIFTVFSLWVLSAAMWCAKDRSPLETVGGTLSGFIYVPCLLNFMALVVFAIPQVQDPRQGGFYLLYLLIVTKFCDMGALLTGMVFGRHKMVPRISPKKTWEGLAGGIVLSVAASWFLVQWLGPERLGLISPASSLVLGLLLALVSVVGDLAESYLKRGAHIKDSGSVIPGIGGVLDLVDSLLFTAPVLYFYLRFLA